MSRFDLLRTPAIGRFLRWRWGRLSLQLGMLALTAVLIYDGVTGPQLAPNNLAGVAVWVHYRGFVMLALLLAGNLFCMACPFALPRTLGARFNKSKRRFPKRLRNKWTAVSVLFLFLWLYEWLDLWASPLFTVWVILAYFAVSFTLEFLFQESPFCKYICPLGTFNYTAAAISPLQITVNSGDVCRSCVGNECVNGSADVLGCGTELFAPQMQSNMDCTFCLDCARACPHDNIILATRNPLHEAIAPHAWPARWDMSMLALIFTFAGLSNAFGMVPPVYALQVWLSRWLPLGEGGILFLILGTISVVLPVAAGLSAAAAGRWLSRRQESLRTAVSRYTPAFLPFAFAIWFTHYAGFHFFGSALTIIPVTQNFLLDHNIALFGQPNWALSSLFPLSWLNPLEMIALLIGFAASFYAIGERAHRAGDRLAAQAPWLLMLALLGAAAMVIFYLPMEMRGAG